MTPRLPSRHGLQHGLAAVTALLIVAVAASAATMMLSQQSALLDQTVMVSNRAQAELYAHAGIDWARGVLAQDARTAGQVDSLDEPWAQPIAALPVERAVVAGSLVDEQGKFNLNNLLQGTGKSEPDLRAFRALLVSLSLAPELADAVLDWIDPDSDLAGPGGAEDAFYLSLPRPYRAANRRMAQVEELYRVRGFDARTVARLRPYVTAIEPRTPLNVNTASDLVLAAVLGVTSEQVAPLLAMRRAKPFAQTGEIAAQLGKQGLQPPPAEISVNSAYFAATVQVSQDDVQLATEALISRGANGATAIIWRRPRY